MRQVLFLLLFSPLFAVPQRTDWDVAYHKSIPAGLGKPIHLPKRDHNPHFRLDDMADYNQKSRVFVVTADSIYQKLFWRYVYTKDSLIKYSQSGNNKYHYKWMEDHLVDSVPAIDFSKNELVMYAACAQCFAFCKHESGETNCHRNACSFREKWFIRKKEKPRLE